MQTQHFAAATDTKTAVAIAARLVNDCIYATLTPLEAVRLVVRALRTPQGPAGALGSSAAVNRLQAASSRAWRVAHDAVAVCQLVAWRTPLLCQPVCAMLGSTASRCCTGTLYLLLFVPCPPLQSTGHQRVFRWPVALRVQLVPND